jgi:NAD(P)-dependent dehydrogenase (short-subunit alcohol dehydrogenase family)
MAFIRELFHPDYRTTAQQIITRYHTDLTGKTAFITGCTSGIGVETARALAHANATVFISGRNAAALSSTRDALNAELKQAGKAELVRSVVCDLSLLSSVRTAAADFHSQSPTLHLLICNAGLMASKYAVNADGVDMQFAVNHIGHWLLFTLLQPTLLRSAPSRVVAVSSSAHGFGAPHIDYSRLPSVSQSAYSPWGAYQQAKLANILFAQEIQRRYAAAGITAYSLHPGGIRTGLQEDTPVAATFMWLLSPMLKSVEAGASTTVYCAVAPDIAGGEYYKDCTVTQQLTALKLTDGQEADKLWKWTEDFVAQHSAK